MSGLACGAPFQGPLCCCSCVSCVASATHDGPHTLGSVISARFWRPWGVGGGGAAVESGQDSQDEVVQTHNQGAVVVEVMTGTDQKHAAWHGTAASPSKSGTAYRSACHFLSDALSSLDAGEVTRACIRLQAHQLSPAGSQRRVQPQGRMCEPSHLEQFISGHASGVSLP